MHTITPLKSDVFANSIMLTPVGHSDANRLSMLLSVQYVEHVAPNPRLRYATLRSRFRQGFDLRLASHTSFTISSMDHGQPIQSTQPPC